MQSWNTKVAQKRIEVVQIYFGNEITTQCNSGGLRVRYSLGNDDDVTILKLLLNTTLHHHVLRWNKYFTSYGDVKVITKALCGLD